MFLPVGGRVAANVHAGQGGVDVAGADQAGGDAEVDVGDGDAGGSTPKHVFPHEHTGDPKRCYMCLQSISKIGNYKDAKNKLSKTKTKCQMCNLAVCGQHSVVACEECSKKLRSRTLPGSEETGA